MNAEQFQKELRATFDAQVEVHRDKWPHLLVGDYCYVVWDRTKSGAPYPAMKVACEHDVPAKRGTPRDPTGRDIDRLRSMNWSRKYNHRRGARKELFNEMYRDPDIKNIISIHDKTMEASKEVAKPYVEWRTGVRNTVAVKPANPTTPTGDRRSRDSKERTKKRIKDAERGCDE